MDIDFLDVVEQCQRLVKQAGKAHGLARWKTSYYIVRLEGDHSYRETPNRQKYIAEIRDVLGFDQDDLPDYSTIYKLFDWLEMWVWRVLLL